MTRRTASRRSRLATRSNCVLLGLASGGVYLADRSPDSLVRSYRTVSPLPRHALASQRARSAVCFLWHCPGPCERWALPTTVSCEARTFLGEITQGNLAAAARPTPPKHCTGRLRQEEATVVPTQGDRLVWSAQSVGWDQWRFVAPAHHDFSTLPDGGPALEASWSHPTLNKGDGPGPNASVACCKVVGHMITSPPRSADRLPSRTFSSQYCR